jgi:hypothetical protein
MPPTAEIIEEMLLKPELRRQKGKRNLFSTRRLKFANNTRGNKNTRRAVRVKQWPPTVQRAINEAMLKNDPLSKLTQKNYNSMSPSQQNLIQTMSRLSGPMSRTYQRPYRLGNYGSNEAKLMANLTAHYNTPREMMIALNSMNLNNNIKNRMLYNIASLYRGKNGRIESFSE